MADYTRWYRVGTVALTKNSKTVTGSGTYWLSAGLNPGDLFTVDASQFYEVNTINSNTELTLKTAYSGNTTSETDYSIVRNFTAQLPAQVAAQTADLLNDFRRYVDADMQSIHGKSAYQIACEKGYVGTESQWVESLKGDSAYTVAVQNGFNGTQSAWVASLTGDSAYTVALKNGYKGSESEWLESLKAAAEWSALDARTQVLTTENNGLHNSIYRGKNLGEFTSAHQSAITSGKYTDMWIGDYFTHDGKIDIIAQFGFAAFPNNNNENGRSLLMYRATPIESTDDMVATFNRPATGTEGEEGYDPGTQGKLYLESNWFTVVKPKFEEEISSIYGAGNLRPIPCKFPTAMNGTTVTAWTDIWTNIWSTHKAILPQLSMFGLPFPAITGLPYWYTVWPRLPLHILNCFAFTNKTACAEALPSNGKLYVIQHTKGWFNADPDISGDGDAKHVLCPMFLLK